MSTQPSFPPPDRLSYGVDPYLDAWILHFMTENNLDHYLNPGINASFEQLRFMVDLDEEQVFAPCPDRELEQLLQSSLSPELLNRYNRQWRRLASFVLEHVRGDRYLWRRIIALCRHKYRMVLSSPFVIPDRLMKRFLTIFLTQTGIDDPMRQEKQRFNRRADEFADSERFRRLLDACPGDVLTCTSMENMRRTLDLEELRRLLCLATWPDIWQTRHGPAGLESLWDEAFSVQENFADVLGGCLAQDSHGHPLKILYIPDDSGGIIFDIMVLRALMRQGHRVTLTLKEGFYFYAPTVWDLEQDAVLADWLSQAVQIQDNQISKNELLTKQRENPFLVISDGTRERLNLYRTGVTFARAWKESDLILAKGEDNARQFLDNSHVFTRDILGVFRDDQGRLRAEVKAKSARSYKFTEAQLLSRAEEIIQGMRKAKNDGKKVMFYSAVIGSLPGQTQTAIRILQTFVVHLRQRLPDTFIINPAEHFEPGMDADDLMYMWEKVQRSGLIDVWRFQTVQDIETSFELLGQSIPPVWIGKDATFSTGCTKEMNIALSMQKQNPELQIIGPDPEKFFRRREYGVGKFFDSGIEREPERRGA